MSKSSKIEKINAETRERATETAATFLQFTYPEDGIEKFSQIFNRIQQFFNANFQRQILVEAPFASGRESERTNFSILETETKQINTKVESEYSREKWQQTYGF